MSAGRNLIGLAGRFCRRHRRVRVAIIVMAVVVVLAGAGTALVAVERHGRSPGSERPLSCAKRSDDPDRWITRSGSSLELAGRPWRFSGVNMYWLGLDDNVLSQRMPSYPSHEAVRQGFSAADALCSRVVRSISLGVSVGSPRSLEPRLGVFNNDAFAAIDYAVARARQAGLRLMIPLTDQQNYYEGGVDTFASWFGVPTSEFYTDPLVVAAFDNYVTHLLSHVNPLTGLRLGDDPTVAVWETGNEDYEANPNWTEQTAALIKQLAPHALVADGSAATGEPITQTGVDDPDVDIIDAHFYPVATATARSDAAFVTGRNKVFMIGEYPLITTPPTLRRRWLAEIAADHRIAGDLAWSLLPYLPNRRPELHADGYTFHFPPIDSRERSADTALQDHARAMRDGT